jgi:hypothetical protein
MMNENLYGYIYLCVYIYYVFTHVYMYIKHQLQSLNQHDLQI